jgi:putative membrane protein
MKKLMLNILMAGFLLGGYGCNTKTTDTQEKNTEIKDTDNQTAAETNAKSGIGGGSDNDSGTTATTVQQYDTTSFAVKAASGGLMEVALGNLAQQKGANADVKKFGQRMVTDHSKANTELKTIATAKNIMLPTAPLPKHQKHIEHLGSLSGAEFDKQYMTMMVEDHQEDVSLFQTTANDNSQDAELKGFAQKTLPVLKTHLQMAQQTQAKVK